MDSLGDVELSTVKGLNTVEHHGPSTIGIDNLYKSDGKIPDVFLRGAGVPENLIAYCEPYRSSRFEHSRGG
jgi:hypothetical protein